MIALYIALAAVILTLGALLLWAKGAQPPAGPTFGAGVGAAIGFAPGGTEQCTDAASRSGCMAKCA